MRNLIWPIFCLGLALVPPGAAAAANAAEAGAQDAPVVLASREYFVDQQASEVLVIRASAFEAEFDSRVLTDKGELIVASGLPDARVLPVFQFIAETEKPRQLNIEVAATQVTGRTEFSLEVTRLNVRDQQSANLAHAYRLLSLGMESLRDGTVPDWTVRINALIQAGGLFEQAGNEEMRMWCNAFAAHLVLHRLRDRLTALDMADEVLAETRISRYPQIEFAALKVRSTALAATGGSELQAALETTRESAAALGYRFEEATALNARGVDLDARGRRAEALQQFQSALAIAIKIGAGDLATAIREHIVAIHEAMGDDDASGEVLRAIESQLAGAGENEELARNLLQQGRLLIAGYRYREAIDVLLRAQSYEQSSLTRIQVDLALGKAYHEAGRNDEALPRLRRAIVHPETGELRQPSEVLDLGDALGILADIYRQQGAPGSMGEFRAAQRDYITGKERRAAYAYERAADTLARYGANSPQALAAFADSEKRAAALGETVWRSLSLLAACGMQASRDGGDECSSEGVAAAFRAARAGGSPRQAAESALLYARLLRGRGRNAQALQVADELVEELVRLQASQAGALGAWYWQHRWALFDNYMALNIAADSSGARSLLALARLRFIENPRPGALPELSPGAMRAYLQSLPRGAAVLSYFISDESAHAWLAGRDGVVRTALPRGAEINRALDSAAAGLSLPGQAEFGPLMARLGSLLVQPISGALPQTIYFLPHGRLLGIPLDAVELGGEPLIKGHRVINLTRFPARPDPGARIAIDAPRRVFLAGDPRDYTSDYLSALNSSPELRAATDAFVGPGLHAVQGIALLRDEFADERFFNADLIHLALPGIVDLDGRNTSSLQLSEPGRGLGRERLLAADLRAAPLVADLAFLSRTRFVGQGMVLENDLGVVSAVLNAGAGAAIASLWPVGEDELAGLVADFYRNLAASGDLLKSLAETKRDRFRKGEAGSGYAWASLQLFIE